MFGSRIKEAIDIASDALIDLGEDHVQNPGPARHASEPLYQSAFPVQADYRPAQVDAADAIKFAAMYMKNSYDAKHKPIFFKVGDFVSLRLHRGYNVPGIQGRNTKIEQQFAGPFRILERIGRLAYRIELPPAMKIHPVISVAHLEPCPDPAKDPFGRPFAQNIILDPEPEKILNKRTLRRRGGGLMTEYLIRFTGRPVEYDQWMLDRNVPERLRTDFEARTGQGLA